jgi:anti-sigma factor RsiW
MNHIDEMTCLLYLDGQLDRPAAGDLEAHVRACEACAAMLRALEHESLGFAHAFTEVDEELPARLAEPERVRAARWAWLLGFGVAGAAAYAVWAGVIEPVWESLSQAGFGASSLLTLAVFNGAFWKGWTSMIDTIETAAVVALGILALSFLPLRWPRRATIGIVVGLLAMVAGLGLAQPTSAAEVHKQQSYRLEKGQVVHDDLIVAGQSVEIDGTVDGDLIVFARSVTVRGHVTGDILGFAQDMRVDGTVDDNIRAFVNTLTLNGSVGKNVSIGVGNADIGTDAKIGGSLTDFGNDMMIEGSVGRGLLAAGARTEIEGTIGGSTCVAGQQLSIGSTAVLNGPIEFKGAQPPEVSSGAHLASPVVFVKQVRAHRQSTLHTVIHEILRYGFAVLIGLLLMTILPGFFDAGVRTARRWPLALSVGALTTIIWIFLFVMAIVFLVVGVPAGIALVTIYLPLAYLSQMFVGAWLGEKIMPKAAPGIGGQLGQLALGLLVIHLLGLVPYVRLLVCIAVVLWGIGAILLAIYEQSRRAPAAAVAA